MRIEYVNKITGKSGVKELPRKFNLVRIGSDARNDVVLDSHYVDAEAAVLNNDVAGNEGWCLWNRGGKIIRVGDVALRERDQYALLRPPRAVFECEPFVLTVIFDRQEPTADEDDVGPSDRACAELVTQTHAALVDLHPNDPADRAEWLRDSYLHRLEKQIQEIAGRRPDFPPDDHAQTDLGNHLAGVAVRSALRAQLIAHSGMTAETFQDPEEANTWGRHRTALPEMERQLGQLTAQASRALGMDRADDLGERTRRLTKGFWDWWRAALRSQPPSTRLRRYLALARLTKEIKDVWYGFGPLQDLLEDPTVTEIMVVDGDHIWVEKDGQVQVSGRRFLTDLLTIIQRLMARAGRQISTAQPMADARMPDGSRVNAVIPPLALRGPCLTIRRFPRRRLTVEDLVERHRSLTRAACEFLRAAVVNRRNIIVAGGAGAGKTTLLNCLSAFIPDNERIVTIEDTAELQLQKEHVVVLQARRSNSEAAGAVTIRDLVRNALRMRPDRIIVGECRDDEAIDMLQAMNTGHDGSMTTLHANHPEGVVRRLEVLVQRDKSSEMPVETIHRHIASAVHLIVQLGLVAAAGRGRRVVTEIVEVTGEEDGRVRLVPLFRRGGRDGELRPTGHLPTFLPRLIAAGLVRDPVEFVRAVEA